MLALLALTIVDATRGSTRSARAELDRAVLSAAADAGIALTVQALAQPGSAQRFPLDGRMRDFRFDDAIVEVRVTNELSKIPLNKINDEQAEAMFAAFGLRGAELEAARDAFLDWRDSDDLPRLRGRERADYAGAGVTPRDGPLRSNGELAEIPAIGPDLAKRMDPFVTVFAPDSAEFAESSASPLARRVMAETAFEDQFAGAAVVQGGLVEEGTPAPDDGITGRPLRIVVRARNESGSAAWRNVVVELTGNPARPYVVRSRD